MEFNDKPVLVTGANGFIGRRLVKRLLKEGISVRAFDMPGSFGAEEEWRSAGADIVSGDVSSAEDVAPAVRGCQTVIHLAAVVLDWGPESLFERVTVNGTKNILDAASIEDAKVVVASSIAWYGDAIASTVCHEGVAPGRPIGAYGRSKRRQEEVTQEFIAGGGRAVIIRPAQVYGAGSHIWVDELVKVLRMGLPSLIGREVKNAEVVHVENVVDIMIRAARDPRADGKAYNASDSSSGVTWERYMSDLARVSSAPKPRSIPLWLALCVAWTMQLIWTIFCIQSMRPPFTFEALNLVASDVRAPNTRAVEELGHEPQVTYDQGMQEVTEYLQGESRGRRSPVEADDRPGYVQLDQ